jgi:uncharacterized LabA/DUF88 family protein
MKNLAFIDGQNLHMGIKSSEIPWKIDLLRFIIYLKNKYHISTAYYFWGYEQIKNKNIYKKIKEAGYKLIFKQHNFLMSGKKKGNVDSDIIFMIMKKMYKREDFDQIILISGDGDYKNMVDFLIEEKKFKKILFPNRKYASSLYKKLGSEYFDFLENEDIKNKIKRAP